MRTQGGGGQKTVKFCGRPLWMAPNIINNTHDTFQKLVA